MCPLIMNVLWAAAANPGRHCHFPKEIEGEEAGGGTGRGGGQSCSYLTVFFLFYDNIMERAGLLGKGS